jgi:hypothetical protein
MTSRWLSLGASVALPFLLVAGCSLINAPGEVRPGEGGEGGEGGWGSSSTTNASSSSSGSGGGSSSSGSSSASSGSGGSMMACMPGATESCYDGPGGTAGVGNCKSGTRTCDPMGAGFGPCQGQVLPAQEDCATSLVDEDCDGLPKTGCKPRVVIVASTPGNYEDSVAMQQMATGAFAAVDVFKANIATPPLDLLMNYEVALVFSDSGFYDAVGLGNVIADYYDAGGRVVLTTFAVTTNLAIQGRFGDPAMGYLLIDPQPQSQPTDKLGTIFEPQSPLMTGVNALDAPSAYRSPGGAINGAIVVASWQSGVPLVVRGVVKNRNRVDLNFYPPPMFWTGNGIELVRNALLFE